MNSYASNNNNQALILKVCVQNINLHQIIQDFSHIYIYIFFSCPFILSYPLPFIIKWLNFMLTIDLPQLSSLFLSLHETDCEALSKLYKY